MNEVQSVKRAIAVLKDLSHHQRGRTLSELSLMLNIPVTSTLRILKTLESDEFVTYSKISQRYFIGSELLSVARLPSDYDLKAVCEPVLRELSHTTGETVFIGKFVGDKVICTMLSEGHRNVKLFVQLGQEMPLHSSASARCLLAGRSDHEVDLLVNQDKISSFYTPLVQNMNDLRDRLGAIRQKGYETSSGELNDHAWAISAPIHANTGEWVACLTLTTPVVSHADHEYEQNLTSIIVQQAQVISARLGG